MALTTYLNETVTAAGVVVNLDIETPIDTLLLTPSANPTLLLANVVVNFSGTPSDGQVVSVGWIDGFSLNGNTFTVNGVTVTDIMLGSNGTIKFSYLNSAWVYEYAANANVPNAIDGGSIKDETLTLAKIEDVASANILLGSGANRPTATAVTGDVTISNTGVTSITAGAIVNADINAAAAIARTKVANGTASHVLINDGSGVMSSEAALATSRGGLGTNASASTGFVKMSSGVTSIGLMYETLIVPVSFEAGEQGTIYVDIPYACTILSYQFCCTFALAGTDNASMEFKNNSDVVMTGSTISIPASTAFGTRVGATITANGAVAQNDDIRIKTDKTTPGGRGYVSITLSRTA